MNVYDLIHVQLQLSLLSQWANIRNMNSLVVKHYVESKKDKLEYRFLKPEFPFKFSPKWEREDNGKRLIFFHLIEIWWNIKKNCRLCNWDEAMFKGDVFAAFLQMNLWMNWANVYESRELNPLQYAITLNKTYWNRWTQC